MLQEEPIGLDEVKAVIQSMKHMPSAKRTSVMVGVLAVQLLLECRDNFDAQDFDRAFTSLARYVAELKQDLSRSG